MHMKISHLVSRFSLLLSLFSSLLPLAASAQASYDLQRPFGFATCTSRTSSGTYNMVGGGGWLYNEQTGAVTNQQGVAVSASDIMVLTSNGGDMLKTIQNAIKNYKVVVFDGADGDFLVSKTISLSGLSGKTLLGIHGARLCTRWHVTPAITAALDTVVTSGGIGVKTASTSSGGGTLPNGQKVSEEGEFLTRRTIMGLTGDQSEAYRSSGIFSFSGCSNFIIRNIAFVGPGAVDVSGSDLISFGSETKHMWVDHCEFSDGMDGNFDITKKSDFNTITWCTFSYTARSYDHQNTNLIGSSDSETTGYLNTTFANNVWGAGCRQRMPMARVGKIHLINNYYDCPDAAPAVNPRKNSEFLIEGNYFSSAVSWVFAESGATAYVWSNTNRVMNSSAEIPSNRGSVSLPYSCTRQPVDSVVVNHTHAGAKLYNGVTPPVTAVESVSSPAEAPEKVLLNGRLLIRHDGRLYDLSGF